MEKQNKKYFVYKTTNIINGKFYIGVHETYNINDGYLGSGKILRNSIYYYGKENFHRDILEFCNNKFEMYQREKEIVTEELISDPKCMNLTVGGVGFINDEKHKLISKYGGQAFAKRLKEDPEYRNKVLATLKSNVIQAHKDGKIKYDTFTDKKHSEETKKKMSKSHQSKHVGEKNSQFGTCWINNNKENKKIKIDDITNYPSWNKGRLPIGNVGKNQYF